MKTRFALLAVLVAMSVLTSCKTTEPEASPGKNTAQQESQDAAPAPVPPEEQEMALLKRDIDTNIKEGNAALEKKDYDRAERILLAALKQCDLYTKQEARQGAILNSLAAIYEAKEMYAQAVPLLNKAQKLFIRAFGRKNQAVYITLDNLGRVLAKQYRWQEAADVYQTACNLMAEDANFSKSELYKKSLTSCFEAWTKAGNAHKAGKIQEKLKAFK